MSFIKLHEYEIKIPGLKEPFEILQISDTHLLCCDEQSSPDAAAWVRKRESDWAPVKKFFAEANHETFEETTSVESFSLLSEYILAHRPDLLIHSGDAADQTHDAATRLLQGFLKTYGGGYLFVPGNHEDPAVPGLWDDSLKIYRGSGFCVAALNNSRKTVSDQVLSAFERLCTEKLPVILVMHIPLVTDMNRDQCRGFTDGNLGYDYFVIDESTADQNARRFIELIRENKNVRAVLCGHIHVSHVSDLTDHTVQICSAASMNGSISKITLQG